MIPLRVHAGSVHLQVKTVSGASRTRITLMGDRLKVAVPAPAEKGRANVAVLDALEELFGVPVTLISGTASPHKIVSIAMSADAVRSRLLHLAQ